LVLVGAHPALQQIPLGTVDAELAHRLVTRVLELAVVLGDVALINVLED